MNRYLLADDLSGALEAGAAFRSLGTPVTLVLDTAAPMAGPGLRVLSSETRNAVPAAAAAVVRRLLAEQRACGARLVFKKIDSTLRGPVGAELAALITTLDPPLVVVCSATPAAGRTVRDGVLRVNGVPVAETEFGADPGWPIRASEVKTNLANGGVEAGRLITLAELRGGGARIGPADGRVVLSDAETDADLCQLVHVVQNSVPDAVFVGAGGLARAVAEAEKAGRANDAPRPSPRSTLFVSGSLNERSRRQLEWLRDACAVPLHEVDRNSNPAQTAAAIAKSMAAHGAAILTLNRNCGPVRPAEPIGWISAVVTELGLKGSGPEMLVATGGETARALCAVVGLERLELITEYEPGVVLAAASTARQPRLKWVVVKPGGFGSQDVWQKVRQLPNNQMK